MSRPPEADLVAYRGFLFCKQCGCQITAEEKLKRQQNGNIHRYVYYHCTHRRPCGNRKAVEEKELAKQLDSMLDSYAIDTMLETWALESIENLADNEADEREVLRKARLDDGKVELTPYHGLCRYEMRYPDSRP